MISGSPEQWCVLWISGSQAICHTSTSPPGSPLSLHCTGGEEAEVRVVVLRAQRHQPIIKPGRAESTAQPVHPNSPCWAPLLSSSPRHPVVTSPTQTRKTESLPLPRAQGQQSQERLSHDPCPSLQRHEILLSAWPLSCFSRQAGPGQRERNREWGGVSRGSV